MTTQTWNSVVDNTATAGFRAWGAELAAKIQATTVMVQTADTGQINWATVTLPAGGAYGGYEIYKLNDSLFATAPVYFKIRYGSNGSNAANIAITVGTSTNGAGVLGGTALSAEHVCVYGGAAPPSAVSTFDSYLCANTGFFGFYWKVTPSGGTPTGIDAAFYFQRTCDAATGTPNAQGAHAYWPCGGGYAPAHQAFRYASAAAAYTATTTIKFCFVPQAPASSYDDSGISQAYVHYTITPTVRPMFGTCSVQSGEVSQATAFTATMVGTAARTYLALRPATASGAGLADVNSIGGLSIAMLWE